MGRLAHVFVALVALASVGCGGSDDANPVMPTPDVPFSTTDLRGGTGAEAVSGKRVTVNYAGWLYQATLPENKGTQFDRGQYAFTMGANQVIRGFEQGVLGMRVGGVRRVVVPPELGYGAAGVPGAIPPNATLVFEIELADVQD